MEVSDVVERGGSSLREALSPRLQDEGAALAEAAAALTSDAGDQMPVLPRKAHLPLLTTCCHLASPPRSKMSLFA